MPEKALARERILDSAKELFREKGFEHVSVREIAQRAECSHTTIYFYFKDKLGVLEEMAKSPLEQLYDKLFCVCKEPTAGIEKVRKMAQVYVEFGLENSDLYELFITYKGIRMDSEKADWYINELRLKIFSLFNDTLTAIFEKYENEHNNLDLTRGIFFTLHGTVMTYMNSDEDSVIERVLNILNNYFNFVFKENSDENKKS